MVWSPAQRSRLGVEKEQLEKYFRHGLTWIDPLHETKVEVVLKSNANNEYKLRIYIPADFPNSCPILVVVSPKKLQLKNGARIPETSSSFHTLQDADGFHRICHFYPPDWTQDITLYQVFMKGRLWIEAYEAHLQTGRDMDVFLGEQKFKPNLGRTSEDSSDSSVELDGEYSPVLHRRRWFSDIDYYDSFGDEPVCLRYDDEPLLHDEDLSPLASLASAQNDSTNSPIKPPSSQDYIIPPFPNLSLQPPTNTKPVSQTQLPPFPILLSTRLAKDETSAVEQHLPNHPNASQPPTPSECKPNVPPSQPNLSPLAPKVDQPPTRRESSETPTLHNPDPQAQAGTPPKPNNNAPPRRYRPAGAVDILAPFREQLNRQGTASQQSVNPPPPPIKPKPNRPR